MKKLFLAIPMTLGIAALGTACGSGSNINNNDLCPDDPAKLEPGACGCGVADADLDGNNTLDCFEGSISVSWTLVEGDNNTVAACPTGFETVAVISEDSLGEQYTDLFDCQDGGGTTQYLPAGNYLVWLQVTDDTGAALYAQSLSSDAPVVGLSDTLLAFEVSLDRGSFYLSWEALANGAPSDCATVGGTSVSVLATDENDVPFEDLFNCEAYGGDTAGLPVRMTYSTSVSILDSNELALDIADLITATLDYGNHYYDLGHIMFDVAL